MKGKSKRRPLALIVDDEADIRELLEITLMRMELETVSAATLAEARTALEEHIFDLCLLDMRLPDGDGIELVGEIVRAHPRTPVAMITAHGSMETAVEALKAGAFDFVSKPVDLPVLRKLVHTALKLGGPTAADNASKTERQESPLHGRSAAMEEVRNLIAKLARSQAPVHISGESGTGKELAARLIHQLGPRREGPFVAVNCGAIPHELMESELFGHRKGAFTGAVSDNKGLFLEADGGTLFLDEVADLPLSMQVKLLRVIQEKRVRPVGSTRELPVDVRIISATHQNLASRVEEGLFRQDLYYRLNVIELTMPPLRERPEDVPELVEHLLASIARSYQQPKPRIESDALEALQNHSFPGNVRELENILERAFALCEGGMIRRQDLGPLSRSTTAPNTASGAYRPKPGENLDDFLARIEREVLEETLIECRWNKTAAAKRLGIGFRSLRYRLSKLNLDHSEE